MIRSKPFVVLGQSGSHLQGAFDNAQHPLPFRPCQGQAGQAHVFGAQPGGYLSELYILNQLGTDVKLQQGQKPAVQAAGLLQLSGPCHGEYSHRLGGEGAPR